MKGVQSHCAVRRKACRGFADDIALSSFSIIRQSSTVLERSCEQGRANFKGN